MRRGLNKFKFALLFTDGGEIGGDNGDGAGGGAEDLYPLDIAEEAPLLPVTMLVLWLAIVVRYYDDRNYYELFSEIYIM